MRLVFLLIFLTLRNFVFASEVLLVHEEKPFVVLSQDKTDPIEIKDRICIVREKKDIACGDITHAEPKYVIAKIDFNLEDIKKYHQTTKTEKVVELEIQRPTPVRGDKVRIEMRDPKKSIRNLTSELVASNSFGGETISKEHQDAIDLALKKIEDSKPFKPISIVSVGMNYVFPQIQYQQAMSPKWGLGMMAMYVSHSVDNDNGSLTGPGFFFTYNRYYTGALNGIWWQLSPGAFRFTVKNGTLTESGVYQVGVLATVGYRYSWKDKVNFGFGVGGMYLPFGRNAGDTGLAFNGFIPSVSLDAGILF